MNHGSIFFTGSGNGLLSWGNGEEMDARSCVGDDGEEGAYS